MLKKVRTAGIILAAVSMFLAGSALIGSSGANAQNGADDPSPTGTAVASPPTATDGATPAATDVATATPAATGTATPPASPGATPNDDPPGDDDGFDNASEIRLGTDPNSSCASTSTSNDEADDKWPLDFNDDQRATTLDLVGYVKTLNKPADNPRTDLNGDHSINTLDLVRYVAALNTSCAP